MALRVFIRRYEDQMVTTPGSFIPRMQSVLVQDTILENLGTAAYLAPDLATLNLALADFTEFTNSSGNKEVQVTSITPIPKSYSGTIAGGFNTNTLAKDEQDGTKFNTRTTGERNQNAFEAPININVGDLQYLIVYEVNPKEQTE
jgi:hypothetical protein